MKAILCTRFGGPHDLELKDLPDPTPGSGEVVVAVKSAALNFFDTLIIAGKYQFKPPFPFSPASEFAGVIESVGAGVPRLKAGDRVLGYGGHGAARQKVAIGAQRVVKIPDNLDFDRAAGLTVIYDPVGGPYAEAALRSIAWAGRFLVIGFAAGEIPKIPLNLALLKGCDIVGVFWGAFIERDPAGQQANMADLVRWAAEGRLSAHVHAVYPLS